MALVVYGLSVLKFRGWGIEDIYGRYLAYIFVPGMLLLQVLIMMRGKGKRRKKTAAAAAGISLMLFLSGCAGIEPEKRMYPLALGVDGTADSFEITYGMPDLPQATGQGKEEENNQTSVLMITGADFDEIEEKYEKSQEKYLDMGHLQVLILSDRLLENERWQVLLDYLKEEPFVGENVYVFRAEDPREILEWEGGSGTSVGEYLVGILENRVSGQEKKGVTLREVYHQRYLTGGMRMLPKVRLSGTELEVWM